MVSMEGKKGQQEATNSEVETDTSNLLPKSKTVFRGNNWNHGSRRKHKQVNDGPAEKRHKQVNDEPAEKRPKSVSNKYAQLVNANKDLYELWKEFYTCVYAPTWFRGWKKPNSRPSVKNQAVIPLCSYISYEFICDDRLKKYLHDGKIVSASSTIYLSSDLIKTFLGMVHPFTAFGLQAQGYVYSLDSDVFTKFLVILPQISDQMSVSDTDDQSLEHSALEILCRDMPGVTVENFVYRGRLHTRSEALLSVKDFYELYVKAKNWDKLENPVARPFDLVFSPAASGSKHSVNPHRPKK